LKEEKIQHQLNKLEQPEHTFHIKTEIINSNQFDKNKNQLLDKQIHITKIDDSYNLSVASLINAVDSMQHFK
jgi:hypothetical protein